MVDAGKEDMLVAVGGRLCGQSQRRRKGLATLCMTAENAAIIKRLFPATAPRSVMEAKRSFGMGDRLGIAAPGQLLAISRFDALPVLAQQSMRELRLTGRTYEQVLDDVSFMVFREGYSGGFGADADHLKNEDEVRYGLSCGYSMLTLDCSDYIHYERLTWTTIRSSKEPSRTMLGALYPGKSFKRQIMLSSASVCRSFAEWTCYTEKLLTSSRKFIGNIWQTEPK